MPSTISDELLRKLAGAAAYGRGAQYFAENRVAELTQRGQRITALVEGSELYRVELNLAARELEGACDCPASEGMDFCKHCVAVCLQWLSERGQIDALEHGGEADKIKAYLLRQPKDALVDQLLELIEADRTLRQRYRLRLSVSEKGLDYKALRKQITASIPSGRHLFRYAQVRAYFERVDELVTYLLEIEPAADPDKLLELVGYGFTRIAKALDTVDDSGGFRLDSVGRLGELHGRLLARSALTPAKRAQMLLRLLVDGDTDLLPEIPSAYTAALGADGEAIFWEALHQYWHKLPAPTQRSDRYTGNVFLIGRLLSEGAEAAEDFTAALAIRARLAVDVHDYFTLAQFCFERGLYSQALEWLEKCSGDTEIAYHWRLRILELRSRVHAKLGAAEAALGDAWKLFELQQTYENYRLLIDTTGNDAGAAVQWRERALTLLQQDFDARRQVANRKGYSLLAAETLIEIFLHEGALDRAWSLAREGGVSPKLLIDLAEASWASHPADALRAYRRAVDFAMERANNQAYRDSIALLVRLGERMAAHAVPGFDAYLAELRVRFRPKRNFCKWLADAFPLPAAD